jgi:hypothetical protein
MGRAADKLERLPAEGMERVGDAHRQAGRTYTACS